MVYLLCNKSTKQILFKGVGIMARMTKMDYQMNCRMQMVLNVNESRHQAKKNIMR